MDLGISFHVMRRTRDLGLDIGGGRQACGHEETPVQGGQTEQQTWGHLSSHQESCQSSQHQHLALLQFWRGGHEHRALHARHQVACSGCRLSQVWWIWHSSIAVGFPRNADSAVWACASNSGLSF